MSSNRTPPLCAVCGGLTELGYRVLIDGQWRHSRRECQRAKLTDRGEQLQLLGADAGARQEVMAL